MNPQAKYTKHIMVCVRERDLDSSKSSCGRCGGDQIRKRFAELLKAHGLKDHMRASKTQCLDACELGAVVVIYPDDLWYTQVQLADVDKIFAASILQDGIYEPRIATHETWQMLKDIRADQTTKPNNKVKSLKQPKEVKQKYGS